MEKVMQILRQRSPSHSRQVASSSTDVHPLNALETLFIKQFQEYNIEIYGTIEEPLFKAKEIGDMLGIDQIRKSIQTLDEECKVLKPGNTTTGLKEMWFLTEDGLIELLCISKKPFAKDFRKWIRTVVKEINAFHREI